MMKKLVWSLAGLALSACVQIAGPPPPPAPGQALAPPPYAAVPIAPDRAQGFVAVMDRVTPVARQMCYQRGAARCDFAFVIDDRPGQPANAYQSLGPGGQPILTFTAALLRTAANADELAFVMGHEAAHHIAGHIPQSQRTAMAGAVLAGVLASAAGASGTEIEQAQKIAATVAVRSYSKEFELQADALGTEIAWRAGFDPLVGMRFFDRLPDPGDAFLGSHPANGQRKAVVAATLQRLQSGG